MNNPKILFKGIFFQKDISVMLSKKSNRKIDPEIEGKIPEIWEKIKQFAKENNKLAYDGNAYRVEGINISNPTKLNLIFSKISYSLKVSLNQQNDKLELLGEDYFAKGSAIGGLLKTLDNKFIFGVRSGKTLSNSKIDIIGGSLEIEPLKSSRDLFKQNYIEIFEETGILRKAVKKLCIIGGIMTSNKNCIFITKANISLKSEEVQKIFINNDKNEMSGLQFVEESDLGSFLESQTDYKKYIPSLLN